MDTALTTENWPELDDADLVPYFFGLVEGLDHVNDDPYGDVEETGSDAATADHDFIDLDAGAGSDDFEIDTNFDGCDNSDDFGGFDD